jgi:hypothetical protein
MMATGRIPILQPSTRWWCPNCSFTDVTHTTGPHTRFHKCRGLKGLTAPMLQVGIKGKVESREREDYVGKEIVTRDGDGKPIMSIVTTRDEGQDCTVLAPLAHGSLRD